MISRFENKEYYGMFRGIVVSNIDPEEKGRIKVFVPGVFPEDYSNSAESLPWCQPAMPLFGGTYTSQNGAIAETGSCSAPHIGANVWLFFEQGDQNNPIYCFGIQSGPGWFAEHENQHVIQTDNVRIRIDENPGDSRSTSKFTSYNENCTYLSQPSVVTDIETTLDIEVTGNVNINIIGGNCNLKVDGNLYKEVTGDYHETIHGNIYKQHEGDYHEVRNGTTKIEWFGDVTHNIQGNLAFILDGTEIKTISEDLTTKILGTEIRNILTSQTVTVPQRQITVIGSQTQTVLGQNTIATTGICNLTTLGQRYDTTTVFSVGAGQHVITADQIKLN